MKLADFLIFLLIIIALPLNAGLLTSQTAKMETEIVTSNANACAVSFHFDTPLLQNATFNNDLESSFTIPNEGLTIFPGKPLLPSVSRFVVVPPNAGLDFRAHSENPQTIRLSEPLAALTDDKISAAAGANWENSALFPPEIAEMSEPVIIRGVRLVKITTYPIQYDESTNSIIVHDHVETEILFTDQEAVNPVTQPIRRHRSRNFMKYINSLAVNGSDVNRDDPDQGEPPQYLSHYLIVTHENCLEYAAPFIEWRRKSGHKVDIISLSSGNAGNAGTIDREIQNLYDSYLEQGIDPFEYILLIGDRDSHYYPPDSQWILSSPTGTSTFGAPHGEYLFACLEGNDEMVDVGISRWPSGSDDRMELAVGRTLLYEATPDMEDPAWFERGLAYSQHWGNTAASAWHITIHTNVRWGEEVLKYMGFDDITFYEYYPHDQYGARIGPVIRDLMNEGSNVHIGRAENYYFVPGRGNHNFMQEVDDNTVFPVDINTSGHGEWSREIMFRTGSGDHLKGYVATSYCWNGPPTAPMSSIWMEMVRAFLQEDLPYGWAYSLAISSLELYFPNFNFSGRDVYPLTKTEVDALGDPGLQAWIGVPRILEMEYPETISHESRYIEVHVTDPEDGSDVADATVTFYVPGNMPAYDDDDYAAYDEMFMMTMTSDADGNAKFIIPEGVDLAGEAAYITLTGRDIRPLFGEIEFSDHLPSVELAGFSLTESEGNEDDHINPGETFTLTLVATNQAEENTIEDVSAVVTTQSPWVEIEDHEISFGNIEAGAIVEAENTIVLHISESCPDGLIHPSAKPELIVEFRSGEIIWRSAIELDPYSPSFYVSEIVDGNTIPTERYDLNLVLTNRGRLDSDQLNADLSTRGWGVNVVQRAARFPALDSGDNSGIEGDLFVITGNLFAVPGSMNPMMLAVSTESGFADTTNFELQVSQVRERAPQGPDKYGYICFDDTDSDWDVAPVYDWIEISPRENDRDFDGTACEFTGRSDNNTGESEVVDLGFTTRFYGREYSQITITTNGFLSMGNQPGVTNLQNWPLDRAMGGGVGMVAPFWDDLSLDPDRGGVYYYRDEASSRIIVEWHRLRHRSGGNSDLIFQVILLDADVWITETGDQNIIFQYKAISNVRGLIEGTPREKNNPFASVGISSPAGNTGISYTWNDEYPVTSAPLEAERALFFATSPRFRSGFLHGYVHDVETEFPVEGATVYTEQGFTAETDAEGYWHIDEALAEMEFNITAAKLGYNDSTYVDTFLVENDTMQIDFSLLHPEFIPSTMMLSTLLDTNAQRELPFRLDNTGNGPLEWEFDPRLPGNADADPWEFRMTHSVGDSVDDSRIQGVVYINDHFYVAGAHDGTPQIYIFDNEGALVDTFAQPEEDRRGMRDLAWDGELIWGAVGPMIYGITTEGEVVHQFESMYSPTVAMTWDPDREFLWVSSTTTNPVPYTRDGEVFDSLAIDRKDLRIYGLAYWYDDPDGYTLYVLNKSRDTNEQMVHKFNPDTGDSLYVATLLPERGGDPGGAFITNQFDVYSWVMINISSTSTVDGGDRIDIWQVEGRMDWFSFDVISDTGRVEAKSGVINPDEFSNFILRFDATGLPMVPYAAELHFWHNAAGGHTMIDALVDVIGPRPPFDFGLLYPADGDTLDSTIVTLNWELCEDPNENQFAVYNIWIENTGDSSLIGVTDTTVFAMDLDTMGFDIDVEPISINWWIQAISNEDTVNSQDQFEFTYIPPNFIPEDLVGIPVEFGLQSIYPNPFNGVTTISFGVDMPTRTRLRAFDISGREAATLFDSTPQTGYYRVSWNAEALSSGVYILRLESAGRFEIAKIALIK